MTGAELKALRKSRGASVAKAARACEVSERTWKRWEASATVPDSIAKLFRLLFPATDGGADVGDDGR